MRQRFRLRQFLGVETDPRVVEPQTVVVRSESERFIEQRHGIVEPSDNGLAVRNSMQGFGQECRVFAGGMFVISRAFVSPGRFVMNAQSVLRFAFTLRSEKRSTGADRQQRT